MEGEPLLRMGTCSWNYASWVGLVYSKGRSRSVDYLPEYSRRFNSAEVDSWFYKMPEPEEVEAYHRAVPADFAFSCKAPQALTQVFHYGTREENPSFLSPELYADFHARLLPFKDKIACVILEFEYMNKEKMAGLEAFIERLETFLAAVPRDIRIGIECRNSNYMKKGWFDALARLCASHVFSEKIYMPSVVSLIDEFGGLIDGTAVIRLLGGDRKEIEALTGEKWDRIVDKKDLAPVARRVELFIEKKRPVLLNINNHYEGSAPLTIRELEGLIGTAG